MTPDDMLKKKTVYKDRSYAIEQMEYDGSWRFTHYCPNGLQTRTWENNDADIRSCEQCEETIPEEIILLWGLIDKEVRVQHVKLRNFNPTFNEPPR